jgi:hypothetical protein
MPIPWAGRIGEQVMDSRFLRPNVIWGGIWVAISLLILCIAFWQNKLYWKDTFERMQKQEIKIFSAVMPYAIAFLEEHGEEGLLTETLSQGQKMFTPVYVDSHGVIKYPPGSPPVPPNDLKNYEFSYVYKTPGAREDQASLSAGKPGQMTAAHGRLYLIPKKLSSLREEVSFDRLWMAQSFLGFTLVSYFLLMVGFAAICSITARFQSHFQSAQEEQHRSELEARDLSIQVLESNLKTLDLHLQILGQEREKAEATTHKAKKAIDRLVKKLQSESSRNEELETKLNQAHLEHEKAEKALSLIAQDIEKIAAEKLELEALRDSEPKEYPSAGSRRSKEYLWLNLMYKNLQFSRRALQNISDIQLVHDVFPSLPDALALINGLDRDSLVSGEGFPSRSAVRYSQPLQHFRGPLWEFRFSKDGRIFFGLSQTRTFSIDTILLKRHFTQNRYRYEKYLENTLGKDNNDLKPDLSQ